MKDYDTPPPPRGARPFLGAGIFLLTLQVLCSICERHHWGLAVVGALLATGVWAYAEWQAVREQRNQGWQA
ncbi:hypothetical protein PMM47T1_07816 [Pseudomonas sp. M47T1]|uniref:hypothetical protein n=1 Tax=Pseudomonas sp. M47T1 TaxID=1179778 RepID=UPI0002606EF8|nr:hypothetical protein [Pseudomonas sp. M47T1]EIK97031.1 hypothetical protein PMM47T1_07816 [Pseudomonas sp. M47T1]